MNPVLGMVLIGWGCATCLFFREIIRPGKHEMFLPIAGFLISTGVVLYWLRDYYLWSGTGIVLGVAGCLFVQWKVRHRQQKQ